MIIRPAQIIENDNSTIAQADIEYAGKQEKIWYAVDNKYGKYLTYEKLDGFLLGMLPLAMATREDITLRGSISEKLYNNLNELMKIYHLAMHEFNPINVTPDSLCNDESYSCEDKIGTAFTGGIDSFFTIYQHMFMENIPPQEKITHLLFSNVGGHYRLWKSINSREIFNSRYELLKAFPEEHGIDFIKIDSNLSEIIQDKARFNFSYSLLYLSCALMLQKLFGKYYYSSGVQLKYANLDDPIADIAHVDLATVHLMSTETTQIVLTGTDFSRVEKTKQLAENGLARHRLNVCAHPLEDGTNCSMCRKCCRTLLTLELLGYLNEYKDVFDLEKWAQKRNFYIINSVLKKGANYSKDHLADQLALEIRDYAESINYKFTIYQKIAAWFMGKVAQFLNLLPRSLYISIRKIYIKFALPT
jgi:hypothetical protein